MRRLTLLLVPALLALVPAAMLRASDDEKPVARLYPPMLAAPMSQTPEQVSAKSDGCTSCHTRSDEPSMHASPAVLLGCVDCHGGDPTVRGNPALGFQDPAYVAAREKAHVLPRYPRAWHYPDSANPRQSYTLLNKEAPDYIRFVNPGDYRVVRQSCGACHLEVIEAAERSIMASGAMLFGGAAYNNGIIPYKNYLLGEAYTTRGEPAKIVSPGSPPGTVTAPQAKRGALAALYPLPTWQVTPPATSSACSSAADAPSARSSPKSACPTRADRSSGSRSRGGPTSSNPIAAPPPACAWRSRSSTSTRRGSMIR